MKKPKVVLKCVKFHQGHEGYGVNADVWIDGVKCLHALDDGNGGCLMIDNYVYGAKDPDKVKSLIKSLNDYVNTIPLKPHEYNGHCIKDDQGNDKMFKTSLEDYIEDFLQDYEKQKEVKKQEKLMKTAILFGVPNAASYSYIKYPKPLATLAKMSLPWLQDKLDNIIKMHCTGNAEILNTNLKELGLTI